MLTGESALDLAAIRSDLFELRCGVVRQNFDQTLG